MNRLDLQEIHDHPSCPKHLRDLVTDALQAIWGFNNTYKPILGHLLAGMRVAGTSEVLDLCSGGGGPWLRLVRESEVAQEKIVAVRLTDKYPNLDAFAQAGVASGLLSFEPSSVDATDVPDRLSGFRTVFSAFHHLEPVGAGQLLSDAMKKRRGVGVFELARRSPRTLAALCLIPFLTVSLAPTIRPFRWSRLFWSWVIPVVPFVVFYDGVVSCLRAYSRGELEDLIAPLRTEGYQWEIGEERSGFLPVTYLIGYPVAVRSE